MKSKSNARNWLLDEIVSTLKHPDIYNTIDYRHQKEDKIKQFLYPHLLDKVTELYKKDSKISDRKAKKNAKKSLLWEGNVKTTVSNRLFLGTQHRPDFVLEFKKLSIAIEIKRGSKGSSLRESIGQSHVYSNLYDFTISLFIDTSKDKKILNSSTSDEEKKFIKGLWKKNNVRFEIV